MWPVQSYNLDADGKVDGELTETEDEWMAQYAQFRTKRAIGDGYKLNSGTWEQEMDISESWFIGQTASELSDRFAAEFSDVNGRPLNGNSDKDEAVAKAAKLTDEQKADIDALSGATMSLKDEHGNLIGAVEGAYEAAKPSVIENK